MRGQKFKDRSKQLEQLYGIRQASNPISDIRLHLGVSTKETMKHKSSIYGDGKSLPKITNKKELKEFEELNGLKTVKNVFDDDAGSGEAILDTTSYN